VAPIRQVLSAAAAVAVVSWTLAAVAFGQHAFSRARLSVSPSHVGSRGRVVVRGSGWSGKGCQNKVHFVAYVVGISRYPTVTVGTGTVSGGRFTVGWRTPQVEAGLEWTIRGEQKCGTTTVVAYAALIIG